MALRILQLINPTNLLHPRAFRKLSTNMASGNIHDTFSLKKNAAAYDTKFAAMSPLKDSLHLIMHLYLLDAKKEANILCVGAGTGQEVLFLAKKFPKWRFTALDPAEAMLDICKERAEEEGILERCEFHVGYLDSLPAGQNYDIATSLMVSHFITERGERVNFFRQISSRLKPEGLLFSADLAYSGPPENKQNQIDLWIKALKLCKISPEEKEKISSTLGTQVVIEHRDNVGKIIQEGGFHSVLQIMQGILYHAWIAKRA